MTPQPQPTSTQDDLVCYCRRVPVATVAAAISEGRATSLAQIQTETTACTRCFGCRFDLERMLQAELGDAYEHEPSLSVTRAGGGSAALSLPRRMYMPVLAGFRGADVTTRISLLNWTPNGGGEPAGVRADLLGLDGRRVHVWELEVPAGHSSSIDTGAVAREALEGGAGVVKLVLDAGALGSLRPYFHIETPAGVTSTHEKAGMRDPNRSGEGRPYYWVFPFGSVSAGEEAWFVATNSQAPPIAGRELVWQSVSGREERTPFPELELDQTALVPLHERMPALAGGEAGTVRLEPSVHVAGFMLRHDPDRALWRVQHL